MRRILFTAVVLALLAAFILSGQTNTFCANNLPCTVTALWNHTGGLQNNGIAVVDLSSAQSLSNKTLTSPALTSPALTTPTIGGETVTSAPRGAFSGSAISLTSTGRVMQIPPDKAITVTSISYTVPPGGTVGAGCTQAPQVRVTDGTTLSSTLTLSNSSGSGSLTGLSVNYAAASDLRVEVAFNATGCSTNWANVNFVVQFKMQ